MLEPDGTVIRLRRIRRIRRLRTLAEFASAGLLIAGLCVLGLALGGVLAFQGG